MQHISAKDAEQRLSSVLETAQREPVTIHNQNGDSGIVLSPQEYDRLRKVNLAELYAVCDRISQKAQARGLTEEKLAEILAEDE